jgi:hypothetical protein
MVFLPRGNVRAIPEILPRQLHQHGVQFRLLASCWASELETASRHATACVLTRRWVFVCCTGQRVSTRFSEIYLTGPRGHILIVDREGAKLFSLMPIMQIVSRVFGINCVRPVGMLSLMSSGKSRIPATIRIERTHVPMKEVGSVGGIGLETWPSEMKAGGNCGNSTEIVKRSLGPAPRRTLSGECCCCGQRLFRVNPISTSHHPCADLRAEIMRIYVHLIWWSSRFDASPPVQLRVPAAFFVRPHFMNSFPQGFGARKTSYSFFVLCRCE